jgi:maltose-binding protein MalE
MKTSNLTQLNRRLWLGMAIALAILLLAALLWGTQGMATHAAASTTRSTNLDLTPNNSVVTYTIQARAKGNSTEAGRITNLEEAARRLNAQLEAQGAPYRVELQGELASDSWSDYTQRFVDDFNASQAPDIILNGHEMVGEWGAAGYVISQTNYISLEWTSTYSDFYPAMWDAVTWSGERWAVPQDTEARPVFFRKDILRDDLGWTDAQITQMVSDTLTGDFTLTDMANVAQQVVQSEPVSSLLEANSLELLDSDALNFPTYHVQGLVVTEDIYYITAIDLDNNRAWLFTVDRDSLAPLEQKDLTEGTLIHPGGIELDGTYLWIPNAEYDANGPAKILALNPQSLEVSRSFTVSTHISLIASNGADRLYGTDWASANFYVWDWDGNPIETIASPTGVEYQDCQFVDPHLVCGGYEGGGGSIDIIDPASWTLVNRINVGVTSPGNLLTREGLSIFDGKVYLLPDDGPDSEVLIYQPTKLRWGLFHRPTAGPDFYILPQDYGGTLYNPATEHLVLSQCPTYRSLNFFYNLSNVWHVTPMSMTTEVDWDTFHQTIVDGDVLFAFGGTWNWAEWRDNYLGGNEQYLLDNVGFMLYPAARRGGAPLTLSHPLVYMISSQSEHPDIAFQILTLASAPDLIAQYSVDSAHLAVRWAATQETVYQNDAFLQDVSYMLDYTTFGPNHEQEDEYKTKLYEAISAVETGSMTPHAALTWLETELQSALGSELEIDTAPCFCVYLPLTLKSFGP